MKKINIFLLTVVDTLIYPYFLFVYGNSWNTYFGLRDRYKANLAVRELSIYLADLERQADAKVSEAMKNYGEDIQK
jgi:hypothetical protein